MRRLVSIVLIISVVCLAICSCNKNDNKVNDLVPVEETPGTDNIQVFVVDRTEGKDISVKIKNLSDEVFLYGEYYSIQILVDGNWFYAPTVEDVVVHDLAHELSPGASYAMTYSLLPYGELDPGHYRIACCDMGNKANIYYAEFNVMEDGNYDWEIVEPTTEEELLQICIEDINALRAQTSFKWDDFSMYEGEDIGSGQFCYKYDLADGGFLLVSGPDMDQDPQQIVFIHADGEEEIIYVPEMENIRIEIGTLLGYEDCYCVREYYFLNHYGWLFYNGNDVEIARQFDFNLVDSPVYYLKDLDGDGIDELICNCTYSADLCRRVYIYRNNNGIIEIGSFDEERMASSLGYNYGLGGERYHNEYYDAASDTLIFYYRPEDTEYEITIDDFNFQEYSENYF